MFKEIKNKYLRYGSYFIYVVIVFFCSLELNLFGMFGYTPDKADILRPSVQISSELYTKDSVLIGSYFKQNRKPVNYAQISDKVINALVATEDFRFFKHHGIDFISVISSGFSTLTGDKRGASTITQQLAKNLYNTRINKNQGWISHVPLLNRIIPKFKEWSTALKLESNYSKEQILTMYLNTVTFGNNTYGIKTAAKLYFNKSPKDLTTPEAAVLIGMLKATSKYNPIKYPENSISRRNVVLNQMLKYNYITKNEFDIDCKTPLNLHVSTEDELQENNNDSYIRSAAAKEIEKWCTDNGYDLYEDGLKIYTTIDNTMQKYAEEAVNEQMNALQKRFYSVWGSQDPWYDSEGNPVDYVDRAVKKMAIYPALAKKYQQQKDSIYKFLSLKKRLKVFTWKGDKDTTFSSIDSIKYYGKILNTGMMSLDPFSSEIKVWVGGINHKYFMYDHVNQSKRQAGSTFKPFAYLAALESGMSPCDKFTDKNVRIKYQEKGEIKYWEPKNADWSASGREMSLRWAMGKSVNTITAQVTEKVGWDNVVKCAKKCGIDSYLEDVPSVSLGPNPVSVYEMVKAYGTFLNKGYKTTPILVQKITDRKGKVLAEFTAKKEKVLTEDIAWLMLYMFRGSMEEPGGTSQALWEWDLWKNNNQIGGKTGTSSNYVDGWYMGITKDLVTGVWVGCDESTAHFKTSQTGEGSRTALPIFGKFMEKVYKDAKLPYKQGPFPKPTTEIKVKYNCASPRIVSQSDSSANDLEMPEEGLAPADINPETPNTDNNKPEKTPTAVEEKPATESRKPDNTPKEEPKKVLTKQEQRKLEREERKIKRDKGWG